MAKQTINIGAAPNDGSGDPLRTAFDKANDNFDELYAADADFETRVGALESAPGGGYSDEQARDAVGAALVAGAGIAITVDDPSDTITVKAAAPSVQAVISAATVTPTFSDDLVKITAQAAGLKLENPTGTAVAGRGLAIRIKDNGTARSIAYGTQYRAIGVTLPTTTVANKTLYLGLIYNSDDTKWDVVAVAQEA